MLPGQPALVVRPKVSLPRQAILRRLPLLLPLLSLLQHLLPLLQHLRVAPAAHRQTDAALHLACPAGRVAG